MKEQSFFYFLSLSLSDFVMRVWWNTGTRLKEIIYTMSWLPGGLYAINISPFSLFHRSPFIFKKPSFKTFFSTSIFAEKLLVAFSPFPFPFLGERNDHITGGMSHMKNLFKGFSSTEYLQKVNIIWTKKVNDNKTSSRDIPRKNVSMQIILTFHLFHWGLV